MAKTPPKGVFQTSDDRDVKALKEQRERARARSEINEFELPEEVTRPHDVQDIRYEHELKAIRTRYEEDDAFRAMWNLIRRQRRESNRSLGRVADAATNVHQDIAKLRELGDKLENIATWKHQVDVMLKITKWVLGVVFTIALGSVIVMATKIYTWGVSSGELEIRLRHMERALERRYGTQFNFPSKSTTDEVKQ